MITSNPIEHHCHIVLQSYQKGEAGAIALVGRRGYGALSIGAPRAPEETQVMNPNDLRHSAADYSCMLPYR